MSVNFSFKFNRSEIGPPIAVKFSIRRCRSELIDYWGFRARQLLGQFATGIGQHFWGKMASQLRAGLRGRSRSRLLASEQESTKFIDSDRLHASSHSWFAEKDRIRSDSHSRQCVATAVHHKGITIVHVHCSLSYRFEIYSEYVDLTSLH